MDLQKLISECTMETALVVLVVISSLTAMIVPLFAHWVTRPPPLGRESLGEPVADLIPPPQTLVLDPVAVRASRKN